MDTESGNRNKNIPPGARKGSREKRPSMISELYTSGAGTRIRGSHGNIHSYHNNRSNFGANRAVSLDQYSTQNRRSSDGLPQVISDNNVYYHHHHHHQHRSLESDVPATITENVKLTTSANDDSLTGDARSDTINRNSTDEKVKAQQQQLNQFQQQHKCTSNKILSSASSAANNSTKSFMSRLRQFTGRFSFNFERDAKRNNNVNANIARNNNANESQLPNSKGSFCCTNKTSSSPLHQIKHDIVNVTPITTSTPTTTAQRNRAFSLDVPVRKRYSSSNSGDSRKSSRNDDNNHIMLMMEDNNSNHTTTIGDNKSDCDESFSAGIGSGGGNDSSGGGLNAPDTGNSI